MYYLSKTVVFPNENAFHGWPYTSFGHCSKNVPVDVAPTVQTLPRTLSDTETLVVKYKQKLEYKKCEFRENIQPYAVWKAAHYLLQNSNIYKNENIQLNTDWLNSILDGSGSLIKELKYLIQYQNICPMMMMKPILLQSQIVQKL